MISYIPIKYQFFFKQIYLTHKYGHLTGTTTPAHNEPKSNDNEGVHFSSQSS